MGERRVAGVIAIRAEIVCSALIWVGSAILGLFLIRAIVSVTGRWLLTRVNQTAAAQMQADLVRHLLTLDGSFFQQNSPGTLIELEMPGTTVTAPSVTFTSSDWPFTVLAFIVLTSAAMTLPGTTW